MQVENEVPDVPTLTLCGDQHFTAGAPSRRSAFVSRTKWSGFLMQLVQAQWLNIFPSPIVDHDQFDVTVVVEFGEFSFQWYSGVVFPLPSG